MNVLVIDVGGFHVKVLATGQDTPRKFVSGPTNPTFCKVFVRYNPEGDHALNHRQASRLKRLSDDLHGNNRRFMFELVVPAEPGQLKRERMVDIGRGNEEAGRIGQ